MAGAAGPAGAAEQPAGAVVGEAGIVHGGAVACPLHFWRISLSTGEALGDDKGCTPTVPVKIDAGRVLICRASTLKAAA